MSSGNSGTGGRSSGISNRKVVADVDLAVECDPRLVGLHQPRDHTESQAGAHRPVALGLGGLGGASVLRDNGLVDTWGLGFGFGV